jgi:hypothetical protein
LDAGSGQGSASGMCASAPAKMPFVRADSIFAVNPANRPGLEIARWQIKLDQVRYR